MRDAFASVSIYKIISLPGELSPLGVQSLSGSNFGGLNRGS
jgi:hypothetical protein